MLEKILSVSEIPYDKKRLAVNMSGGESVVMFKSTFKEYALKEGQDISLEEVKKISEEGEQHIAFTTAIDSISRGLKTQNEIKKLLRDKKFSQSAIDNAVTKLINYNYLNDCDYVNAYISYKGEKNGRRKIIYDLITIKGIDKKIVENLVYDKLSDEAELNKALQLAQKYMEKEKKKRTRLRDKTYNFLAMKGFDCEIIANAMQNLDFSCSLEEDF